MGHLKIMEGFDLDAMLNTIMQWSNLNSGSFNVAGIEGMTALLMDAFSVLDCEKSIIPLAPMEQINHFGVAESVTLGPLLSFRKREKAPFQVLLMGHMDTVFEADHPFQKAERRSQNILNGPGVADMKGGIAVMLEALKAFERHPKASEIGWEVLINPDEEIGSICSAGYFEERAKHHDVGLLFEPAMDEAGTLAGNRKGSAKFTFVARGKAAHAGRDFEKGVNAIYVLAKIISQIEALNGQKEGVTLNVGQMSGGGAANVVPDLAICRLDVRILRTEDETWILNHLDRIVKTAQKQIGVQVDMWGKFTRKPKIIEGKTKKLYELTSDVAKQLGQSISWKPSGGCSDGNNLSAAGLPNIDSLGVVGGHIHHDQEYLLIDKLKGRVELTAALLSHFSEVGF